MPLAFSVTISGDQACRALAADLARRYAEVSGASPARALALGAEVAEAVAEVADGEREIELIFTRDGALIDAGVACAGRRRSRQFHLDRS